MRPRKSNLFIWRRAARRIGPWVASATLCLSAVVVTFTLAVSASPAHAQPGPNVPCDIDEDGDVDLDDYTAFVSCMTGPLATHDGMQTCAFADSNSDGHLDALDFQSLQACFSGLNNPGAGTCVIRPIDTALRLPCSGGSAPDPSQGAGLDLHKVTINAPDAICNDGSPGVFYIRRADSAQHLTRWVLYLEGGGSCTDVEGCAERWCGSSFHTAAKMSSLWAHDAIAGWGIFDLSQSTLADSILVYLYYCSSDEWWGQRSNAVLASDTDPNMTYTLHFRGHRILEEALNMLLAGSVTSDSGTQVIPPLSTATEVLFTGSSGGANGARLNVDWVASHFDPTQTTLRAVFDAGLSPVPDVLVDPADAVILEDRTQLEAEVKQDLYRPFWDESCIQALGGGPNWWRCVNGGYTSLNHITTPFFQRMDITDPRPAGSFIPLLGSTLDEFADGVIASLMLLPNIDTTASEAGQISFVPGVFGSNCGQHTALTSSNYFLVHTVDDGNGIPRTFDEALRAWLGGSSIFIVDDHPAQSSTCTPP